MDAATIDTLVTEIEEWAAGDQAAALARLTELATARRDELDSARNRLSARLHGRSNDHAATAALTLVNRALAAAPREDPLDWKLRWARGRKP